MVGREKVFVVQVQNKRIVQAYFSEPKRKHKIEEIPLSV